MMRKITGVNRWKNSFIQGFQILTDIDRKLYSRARETSLKVNNKLILGKVKGVPIDQFDIFKQVKSWSSRYT